jgi:hypothetical protein
MYEPQKPKGELLLGDELYQFEGTFNLLEAIENSLKTGIIEIAQKGYNYKLNEISNIIFVLIKSTGKNKPLSEIQNEIMELGIASDNYVNLCLQVFLFIRICISKPSERAEVASKLGELITGLKNTLVSHGKNTGNSV